MADNKREVTIPKGMRDFSPADMKVRSKVINMVEQCFRKYSAQPLDTPVLELKDTLMGKYGEDSKLIYELNDQGGQMLALRYDLTVPLARYVAMNGLKEFKRYQIAKVYRRDNPAMTRGRFREFYQCDFDWIANTTSRLPDAECVALTAEILKKVNVGTFTIKVSHRQLLDGILGYCGVPNDKICTICSAVDKLDKNTWQEVRAEMLEKGLDEISSDNIGKYVLMKGEPMQLLKELKSMQEIQTPQVVVGLTELEEIFSYLDESEKLQYVTFDLSLARGLDYYTGVVYEAIVTASDNPNNVGSIAGGGRYDELIGMFSNGERLPAVGVSIGIERIMAILMQREHDKDPDADITVIYKSNNQIALVLKTATQLRNQNYYVDIASSSFNNNKGLKRCLIRADERNIPFIIICGLNKENELIVKNMSTKEQTIFIDSSTLVEFMKNNFKS